MYKNKILSYQDKKSGKIIRYICKKRDVSDFEVNYVFSSFYGMKLNSSEVNSHALIEGKETKDLISGFRNILEDENSSVINFNDILGLFNLDEIDFSVIETSIKKFLTLFEVYKESEYSQSEWKKAIDEKIKSTFKIFTLKTQQEELESITANTIVLQNINFRNYQKRK